MFHSTTSSAPAVAPKPNAGRLLGCVPQAQMIDDALENLARATGADRLAVERHGSDLFLSGQMITIEAVLPGARDAVRASGGTTESAVRAFAAALQAAG